MSLETPTKMPNNDAQLLDEEEMIMTINVHNHDDQDNNDNEELLDDIETDDEARNEADEDSIIILKIQPNIVLNEHDSNHCFYIKCQARVTTLRQVQEILYAFCLSNDHSNVDHDCDDDDNDNDDDDSVRQSLHYYHQKCHYSSSMPNSLHNPLVFINQKPNDDDLKSRAVVHHHDINHHRRYQIRFILMGQLLVVSTFTDDPNPNGDDSLASIPPVMKLLTAASTFHDDHDTPVITIHAVVTKRHFEDTTTTATTTTTPVLPPPSFQQQSRELNRIEPEDDDDLLFYPDDDGDDDSDDDTNIETNRHLLSLFINDDDDDDDDVNDDSDSSVVERDDHHHHDTVDAANTTNTTIRSPPLHHQNGSHNRNRNIPLGFDALRITAGLNRHDVTILRLYFNQDIDQWIQQQQRPHSSGRAPSQSLFPTSNLNNSNNNSTITNYDNNSVDTLRLRRLQEEAWMNVQGPYSEFRYNINAPLSYIQQQRVGGTRTQQNNGNRNNNNNEDTTSVASPLLALPLPPSPATADNNNHHRPDGHRRSHSHLGDSGTLTGTASLTRAIRNRVTSGSQDAVTMYRRAAAVRNASRRPGSTILPLHNGGTNSPVNGNHHAMPASLGSDRDFIYGVIFGSMVGSGMLLWIWIPTVSYKQKLGILFGYALHITINMIHKSFRSDEHFEGDHNMISPDDIHYHNYRYSKNFLINDDTLQLGE